MLRDEYGGRRNRRFEDGTPMSPWAIRRTAPTSALLPVYAQFPIRPVRGRGSWLIDESGQRLARRLRRPRRGRHGPLASRRRARDRRAGGGAALLLHRGSPSRSARSWRSGWRRSVPTPLGRVFFCNSGAEANENALHLARKWTGREQIVSVRGGWHGRTAGTLACTDGPRYEEAAARSGIPLLAKVPADDVAALEAAVDDGVAAVIMEPVQGLSGARDLSADFLRAARRVCDARGAALIFDEVQCGVGRCGAFSTAEAVGVVPDVLTFAKGLASGLPIGAVIATPAVTASVGTGDLGSTFGGGPVPARRPSPPST